DDQVHQDAPGPPLVGREELRLVGDALRGRLHRLGGVCGRLAHHAGGEAEGADQLHGIAAAEVGHQRFPFCFSSRMCSDVLMESARMVQVMFLWALLTNGPLSATKRFLQSWAWHHSLSTEECGLVPMRVVPASWMICTPSCSP